MLNDFLRRRAVRRDGALLYDRIRAQSRQPALYRDLAVPDTLDGRLAMILQHLALVMARLGNFGGDGQALAQSAAEAFVGDLDDQMRKVGVSDLAVPRKVKQATAALYSMHQNWVEFRRHEAAGRAATVERWQALLAEMLAGEIARVDVGGLQSYLSRVSATLETNDLASLRRAAIDWPAIAA